MDADHLQALETAINGLENKSRADLVKVFEDTKSKLGIFCASKSYMNTLLWSHYGDSHKGICLGFHIKPSEQEIRVINLIISQKKHNIVRKGKTKISKTSFDLEVQMATCDDWIL